MTSTVVKSARQQGIGKQLVRACLQQARAWGFEQVVLTVDTGATYIYSSRSHTLAYASSHTRSYPLIHADVDNNEGRRFYKRLGFEEMITDMSEKRYVCEGPWLTTVRAPKV